MAPVATRHPNDGVRPRDLRPCRGAVDRHDEVGHGSLSTVKRAPALLICLDGSLVAGVQGAGGGFRMLAYTGPGWTTLAPEHVVNPGWSVLDRPSLALTSMGVPVAAWTEGFGAVTAQYVARLTDDGWVQTGAPITTTSPRGLRHLSGYPPLRSAASTAARSTTRCTTPVAKAASSDPSAKRS